MIVASELPPEGKLTYYRYVLKTVSPIHIGTNETYLPTNFVIASKPKNSMSISICPECGGRIINNECSECGELFDLPKETKSKSYLYTLTPKNIMSALDSGSRAQLLALSKQDDYIQIRDFFISRATQLAQQGYQKAVVSDEIANEYRCLTKQNRFEIEKQSCDCITQKPVIPGSSLKGSFRTAIINYLRKAGHPFKDAGEMEQAFLNYTNASNDPFKYLKISDAHVSGDVETQIVKKINVLRTGKQQSLNGKIEIIPAGTVFEGTCAVNHEMSHYLQQVGSFYQKQWQFEKISASKLGLSSFYQQQPSSFLIRVGKHSGATSVTVEGYRKIKVNHKKTKSSEILDHATTVWLCWDGIKRVPFGWATLQLFEVK